MAIESPKPKSFKELIHDTYYKIPLYQRSYDWDIDKVSLLWDDVNENDAGYFVGIVLFMPGSKEKHPNKFEIVDGQQRFTTLLLLLRASVEILEKKGSSVFSAFQNQYLTQCSAGERNSRPTLILSKRDKAKFESLLKGESFSKKPTLSSWKNLDNTIQFFRERMEVVYKEKGEEGLINFINEKVLKLSFVDIVLDTESDVYQFFETLNDTGMDLSIADLVKNHVCARAEEQEKVEEKKQEKVEESADAIDDISEKLSSGKFKSFLLHYCWANDKKDVPTPRKKLMEWYTKWISENKNIDDFLSSLEKYTDYYVNFVKPNKCSDRDRKKIFINLDALGATRCYPLLLAGEDCLDNKKDFIKLANAVEILTFRHSTVLKRDAKKLESVFFNLIKDLRNKKDINEIIGVLKKQDAFKDEKLFKLALTNFEPANNKVARYVLLKIDDYITGGKQANLDWDTLTAEHILAVNLDWPGKEEYLSRLGNFSLLSFKMNPEASNKPFKEKRGEVYSQEKRIQITKDLLKYSDFTKETIVSRQKKLVEHAAKIWSSNSI